MNDSNVNIENVKPEEGNQISGSVTYTFPEKLDAPLGSHIKRHDTVSMLMLDVVIALIPAFVWGVYTFGIRALVIGLLSVGSSVGFEAAFRAITHRKITLYDMSAVITGLLIAMCIPVTAPLWMPVAGSFFAIVIVKQLFGGLGKNFLNPALASVVFLSFFQDADKIFSAPGAPVTSLLPILGENDYIAVAHPLSLLKEGLLPDDTIFEMIIGNCPGAIGEVSALLLVAGGVYLLFRKVITWHIPISFVFTVALITFIFPQYNGIAADFMLYEVFSGSLILGAFFMATDYCTSPVLPMGKIIFGVGCGLITVLIRYFGFGIYGVAYGVLFMNLLVPLLDRITIPKSFGKLSGKN